MIITIIIIIITIIIIIIIMTMIMEMIMIIIILKAKKTIVTKLFIESKCRFVNILIQQKLKEKKLLQSLTTEMKRVDRGTWISFVWYAFHLKKHVPIPALNNFLFIDSHDFTIENVNKLCFDFFMLQILKNVTVQI